LKDLIELKYRPSTDPLTSHQFIIYRELDNGKCEYVSTVDDEREAKKVINENPNPANDYYSSVECFIQRIDNSSDISPDYLEAALQDGLTVLEAVESFFSDNSYSISDLKPLKGTCDTFDKEVHKLRRPYISISDSDQATLFKGKHCYYLTPTGQVVTFGGASTHGSNNKHCLMPLNLDEAYKVLNKNK
jgi:hypothetical protein